MVVRNLCMFALLVAFVSATIDCSQEDTCFSEPMDCDPNTSCKTLFRFDEQGNLDLYLRNFTEPMGYAAFAVQKHVDDTYEYFICIPHKGQRLRALAELGEAVLVTEHNISGVVESLGPNNFRCQFNTIELPQKFQQSQEFFVSTGIFDEALVIVDGVQLYNMEPEYDDEEEVLDEESLPVSAHYIGGSSDRMPSEDVFTEVDGDVLTEAIEDMRSMSKTDEEDVEMEKFAKKSVERRRRSKAQKVDSEEEDTRQKSTSHDDDEEDSSDEESLPRRRDHKETRSSRKERRQESRSKSRSDEDEDNVDNYIEEYTRFHEEDTHMGTRRSDGRRQQKPKSRATTHSDDDEEQEEDEYTQRRRDNSKRRVSEDSRRRNTKSRDTDEDEDSEDEYTPRRRDTKRGRPTRYEEDLKDDEDEEYLPKKKSKTRRHNKHDNEDLEDDDESPRSRSTQKNKKSGNDEEDYELEEIDDEYDYDSSSRINIAYTAIIIVVRRFL